MKRSLTRRLPRTLGEIAMIVVGVLIALFLDDWNERRKASDAFEQTLARVYTDVKKDWHHIDQDHTNLQQQVEIINALLADPVSIPDDTLVLVLHYLDLPHNWYEPSPAALSVREQLQWLMINADTPAELSVVEHLTDYVAFSWAPATTPDTYILGQIRPLVTPLLREAGIRNPVPVWGASALNDFRGGPWTNEDPIPTEKELATARDLLASERMRSALEELRARKAKMTGLKHNEREVVLSVMRRIQGEYPDLRLQFEDLGMVGSAVSPEMDGYDAWARTVPMERVPGQEQRWRLDVELADGKMKFRTRESWEENWGGADFPGGRVLWYGDAIKVPAGNYRVTVDLKEDWYRFETLDD